MNLALSGVPLSEKVTSLYKLWEEIEELKLFQFAEVDEVASHIAFILKESGIKYASYWDEVYNTVDNRIMVMMRVLD